MHTPPRTLAATLCALGLLAWALPALAADPVIRTSPGRPALMRDSTADADGKAAKKPLAKPTAEEDNDTIDALRERLARKLGAREAAERASEKPEPGVLRVVARSPVPATPAAATATAVSPGGAPEPGIHWTEPRRAAAAPAKPAAAPKKKAEHWSYHGEGGPEHWGAMKSEYALCSSGKRQSPIDIRDQISVQLDPVQFDYKATNFRVIDNGHTVQVNLSPGNSIEVMGRRYELQQFHFHRPSEERINGRQFDMVVHLVHKDLEGKLAVVAVLLDRGSAQPVVQQVWNNLPLEKGEELAARSTLDLNELLPADRGYFTYMGSLTTPPCSEGVLWMVMKNPVSIAPNQIDIFSRLYPMNARPVQASAGRMIKGSN
ncbi:carbonic anhydrase family protein [Piscinibacter gummiphilus]|uniref:carbonic anhydrase n=1 Tax=Piscinibacter gummiphilus TaxID=946333 RepID=A0ABZ0D3N7_9BURK|nr:carbonic anhydrase family protein [Piscinibacter gummiphilus]WOB09344.1 carbonic anhydrase family protein [Piscinibacter gummiphilus]